MYDVTTLHQNLTERSLKFPSRENFIHCIKQITKDDSNVVVIIFREKFSTITNDINQTPFFGRGKDLLYNPLEIKELGDKYDQMINDLNELVIKGFTLKDIEIYISRLQTQIRFSFTDNKNRLFHNGYAGMIDFKTALHDFIVDIEKISKRCA